MGSTCDARSAGITQAANATVARATATPMNKRDCEYHRSGEEGTRSIPRRA
jgi:hypothetical protein